VRDAGAQPSQRRQLRLLRAIGNDTGVFQKDQHRTGPALRECHEVWPDHGTAIGAYDFTHVVTPARRLLAPGFQHVREAR